MTRRPQSKRRGFTIIEVSLFLALSGLIVVGVMAGATNSIIRHRYVDAANDLVSYLRSVYASVSNTENVRSTADDQTLAACTIATMSNTDSSIDDNYPGRTKCAIYGKVLTFGEEPPSGATYEDKTTIHQYDLIGSIYDAKQLRVEANKAAASSSYKDDSSALSALKLVGADVVSVKTSSNSCALSLAGDGSFYNPQWGTSLQASLTDGRTEYDDFTGVLIIVRSPITGTIHTYYSPAQVNVANNIAVFNDNNFALTSNRCDDAVSSYQSHLENLKRQFLTDLFSATDDRAFKVKEVTFCLNTQDLGTIGHRRAIKINADGRNSTAVDLLSADDDAVVNPETGLCR